MTRLPWIGVGVATTALAGGVGVGHSVAEFAFLPLIAVPFVLVGSLLASRRSENPIGWLFLAFGVVAALDFAAYELADRALEARPPLAGADVAAAVAAHLWHPFFGLFVFSFLLFPDGHLVSHRWRWVARVCALTYVGLAISAPFDRGYLSPPSDFDGAQPLVGGGLSDVGTAIYGGLLFWLNLPLLAISGASLVFRLRGSRGREREQVKLFVYTVATVMFAFPVLLLFSGDAYGVLLFPLIPVAAGVAILRHRLYDIDVVINRALV